MVAQSEYFAGPLPHPDTLKRYNDIVPDAAERIIGMAERQATHRQELEKIAMQAEIQERRMGQLLGFFIAVAVLIMAAIFAYKDMPWPAGILVGTTLVSLVGAFIYGRKGNIEKSKAQLGNQEKK